ncbi:unnamed protein product [Phyllotreta striolata]|uniref:adenylate kinase n=1 Tax=Phyllotreta striolata TaxID=444603 RepID=A0A9P0DUJ2_PHYSR|nr:unnamed protein product [Phyllotreta striolata]
MGSEETQAPIPDLNVPIVWVLGGPGSGKGTQCEKIVERYDLTHLSTGDLLRAEVESGSDRGRELQDIMTKGELVPNETVLNLLRDAMIKALPDAKGFLIDGYPREKQQGIDFEQSIGPMTIAIYFEASDQVLIERLLERGQTSGRADDNIKTIKQRLATFKANNDAILQHFAEKIQKVNAERLQQKIFEDVITILDPVLP